MYDGNSQLRCGDTRTWVVAAFVAIVIAGLAGCATEPALRTEPAPYVGVFTGEFVDGKPLYRLPPIEVVGSRRSVAPGT